MFCKKCGNQMQDFEKYCSKCGTPLSSNTASAVAGENQYNAPSYGNDQSYATNLPYQLGSSLSKQKPRANRLQIAGMVLGIVALVCIIIVPGFSFLFGIAGIICAILGNKKCKHTVGIVGLVCSIVAVALIVFVFIWAIFVELPRTLSQPTELDRLYEQWNQNLKK